MTQTTTPPRNTMPHARGRQEVRDVTSRVTAAELGQRIREVRDARGMSRRALATRLGIREEAIRGYERGQYRPKFERLLQLCEVLDIDMALLLTPHQPGEQP